MQQTRRGLVLAGTLFLAAAAALGGTVPVAAATYQVRAGDTLWAISKRTGASVQQLLRDNGIRNADRIFPGEQLRVPDPAGAQLSHAQAKAVLTAAARNHGLRPSFVLAVSYWESGWNQDRVSGAQAVGLMQVTPGTADWAGPALLGRRVDLHNPSDNAELGAALLRKYLDDLSDPKLALAAYYQGEAGTRKDGIYPSSRAYVDGIWALRNQFEAGRIPR